ncbi:MAG: rhomboid family intramembrane serine protease [Burkholderiaceae bacterium]|nr:rhomboid family intramembrane serine protease [Burkholderiaceae bacterium]
MYPVPVLTPFVQFLILANVIGFLVENLLGPLTFHWFALWPGWASVLAAPWTLVSYSFLHAGLTHLLFNMFALWMFGSDLERVWGTRRLALGYFLGVVTGAIAQIMFGEMFGGQGLPVVGASAGVFAVLLGYAVVFPNRTVMLLFPPIPMPARVFVLLYAALELVLGVSGTASGVAHFAHLGGMLGGWIAYKYGASRSGWR